MMMMMRGKRGKIMLLTIFFNLELALDRWNQPSSIIFTGNYCCSLMMFHQDSHLHGKDKVDQQTDLLFTFQC